MQASDFSPLVDSCCAEVLESMYFTSVTEIVHQPACMPVPGEPGYAFTLRFAGDLHGTFGLHLDAANGRTLAANFLGEEEDSLTPQEVAEVVGELSNMLCGSVVSRIEGPSKFALTHPEPSAPNSAPSSHSSETLITTLVTDSGPILIWIALDPSDSTGPPMAQVHP